MADYLRKCHFSQDGLFKVLLLIYAFHKLCLCGHLHQFIPILLSNVYIISEFQITPISNLLILAETTTCLSDAHAACVELYSSSPVKCSPEEIEQKRQAALQRRSVRLSQTKKKISLR